MKTYEEMARDVLKRRDEELLKIQQTSQNNAPPEVVYPAAPRKRGWIPKIAIPCAATILVGTVGVSVWKNVYGKGALNTGSGASQGEYFADAQTSRGNGETHMSIMPEEREDIYKGGKTEININEAEYWNVYHLPLLSAEDFRPIDDDKINNYYGMEFDRLSRVFPDWKSEHEPFGSYAHDEDDGFVVSHAIICTDNEIGYTTEDSGYVFVSASISERRDSATVENAKPSVINGFDAMVYKNPEGNFAADIDMGIARVTISTVDVDEEEFLNILDVYTKPEKNNDKNTQTMEDKIVVLDGRPDFIMTQHPYEPHYIDTEGAAWRRYSEEELNALYGINFTCLGKLHPDWIKWYAELGFGVYYNRNDDAIGGDIPQNREIVEARNAVSYLTSEGYSVTVIARLEEIPEEDIEHSTVNGYDAVIFSSKGNYDDIEAYGATIDMNGTLVCITAMGGAPEEWFVDFLREYTSEASKYTKPAYLEPIDITTFDAVDPFDGRITYNVSWDVEACWWARTAVAEPVGLYDTDNLETTLGYLKDFFGTDKLPVDEQYKSNLERYQNDGRFDCNTAEGAKAYSPVDGKVVAACDGWYNRGLGRAVAVEFGDGKIFIIGHLDEINVEVGDTVTAGQVLGVCGRSGKVYFEDQPLLTLIAMTKTDD